MGLFNKNKNLITKDSDTPSKSGGEPEQYDTLQARNNRGSDKASTAISIGAVVVTVSCLGLFFLSDIPDKVVAAQAAKSELVANTNAEDISHRTESDVTDDDLKDEDENSNPNVTVNGGDSYIIATLPGVIQNISQDELLDQLESMSDEEYDTFIQSVSELLKSDDPEAVIRQMDPDVRVYFGNAGNANESVADESAEGSVVDAYEAAEDIFGDRSIDASKRLKLIEELNAVDYKYYIAEDGDTLLELSKAFDIGLGQLVELNGIHDADEIPAGMIVVLPSETEVSDDDKVVTK